MIDKNDCIERKVLGETIYGIRRKTEKCAKNLIVELPVIVGEIRSLIGGYVTKDPNGMYIYRTSKLPSLNLID